MSRRIPCACCTLQKLRLQQGPECKTHGLKPRWQCGQSAPSHAKRPLIDSARADAQSRRPPPHPAHAAANTSCVRVQCGFDQHFVFAELNYSIYNGDCKLSTNKLCHFTFNAASATPTKFSSTLPLCLPLQLVMPTTNCSRGAGS